MNTVRYLIAHTDGGYGDHSILAMCDEPTPEDFELAASSLRIIIRLSDLHFYGDSKQWIPISKAELGIADVEGTGPFHDHPEAFIIPGQRPKT